MWFVVGVGYACFASFKVCFAAHYFDHNRMQLNVMAVCVGVLERERVWVGKHGKYLKVQSSILLKDC